MDILVIKLGATGDVVRTTPLLGRLGGHVTWVTAAKNLALLQGLPGRNGDLLVLPWEERGRLTGRTFDLVISLEDEAATAALVHDVRPGRVFGAHVGLNGSMTYTADSRRWFDLSLISTFGRQRADELKFLNRHT